ncbi:MAG TPA: hypothetical protein DCF63_14855 [Planctomycetaceae bacterium]|nr:hypothetical protein [Planctomycetaceae bacterium]
MTTPPPSLQTRMAEAWIDVGGTFTDCLVKTDDGQVRRTKILSSGIVPVSVGSLTQFGCCILELAGDIDGFWSGSQLIGYDIAGLLVFKSFVGDSRSDGQLILDKQPDSQWQKVTRLELVTEWEAPVLAVHRLLQIPLAAPLPCLSIRLGTTRGTNALLTRTGAKTALLVTAPFEDLLVIGDQTRPDLFALDIVKPACLAALTLGIDQRLAASGSVLKPLDQQQAAGQLAVAMEYGCQSLAISLMHSYRNPEHELQLAELARQAGFQQISLSSQLAPVIEYVARTQTTVVDAYLSQIIGSYLSRLCQQFGGLEKVQLQVMTSAGGLVDWRDYSGKDSILSGPAGGVIALRGLRQSIRVPALIGLDMGGTSTDVCRVDHCEELQYESTKAQVRLLTPTLPIETVAAGGGSICWFDGVSLRVGPQSAGAQPGPACYGRGGPLTITDLNVFSGRIPAQQFPFPLDLAASQVRMDELLEQIQPVLGQWSREQLVDGLRRLANQQMADAVRSVSIQQGVDPRDHALVGFGGAAGQHLCEIADSLQIHRIIDHADAGLFSALGMGLARPRLDAVLAVYQVLGGVHWPLWKGKFQKLSSDLTGRLASHGNSALSTTVQLSAELRYQGTDAAISVQWPTNPLLDWNVDELDRQLAQAFQRLHQSRYGYIRSDHSIELAALRVAVHSSAAYQLPESKSSSPIALSEGQTFSSCTAAGTSYDCVNRSSLLPGQEMVGPMIVLNSGSTLTLEENWTARVLSDGTLELIRRPVDASVELHKHWALDGMKLDPVVRDCYALRLSAIATQMGYVLQQTAVSVNVKQRRDFSCAVFDGCGQLLASAPHVPVHLGAMGQTVRRVIAGFSDVSEGDVFLCNDPYEGGSHLPDLTMMMPVFAPGQVQPLFWVANRAHHADIGGIKPGSMSMLADCLEKEGLIISPFRLWHRGRSAYDQLRQLAQGAVYPPRNWSENEADLHAQQAACGRGVQLLDEYAQSLGWPQMQRYAQFLLEASQQRMQNFIAGPLVKLVPAIAHQPLGFVDYLEDGTPIQVTIKRVGLGRLHVDFSGTGPASTSNLNANPSIVTAAVLYVLRSLVHDELPLNEGVLRAIDLVIPESVLNPLPHPQRGLSPAVAAGNVETSQRVVDVLLGALGVAAASQGTMNNVLFGNAQLGFYETICGGSGATVNRSGASAVHTHMTNTRLTDPEVLEMRYPVRLVEFCVRQGSGGTGRCPGGDGVRRTYQFLEPVTVSLLTSRRNRPPFGLLGGGPGAVGENWLLSSDGQTERLQANCQVQVQPGQRVSISTPGGGGFGSA